MIKIITASIITLISSIVVFAHGNEDLTEKAETGEISNIEYAQTLSNKWAFDPTMIFIFIAMILYASYLLKLNKKILKSKIPAAVSFYFGCIMLFVSMCSPIDALADVSFLVHMIQHLIIIMLASLFIVFGAPFPAITKGFSSKTKKKIIIPLAKNRHFRKGLNIILNPVFVIVFYSANMWFWHFPSFYHLALNNEIAHYLQHFLFFISSFLLWMYFFPPAGHMPSKGLFRIVIMFIPMLFDSLLGAVITLQNNLIYVFPDINLWNFDAFDHQRLGGLLMWVGGGFFYLFVMGVLFWDSYNKSLSDAKYAKLQKL